MGSIDSLSADITRELQRYTSDVEKEIEVAKEKVADDLVEELKQKSPKDTGKYAKGWRKKREGDAIIVHNATKYQVAHLLEFGHVKANGGRVPPKVHIAPAEAQAIDEFTELVERAIQQ
ncbi:HK97 gp10 family phage protein [Bacillus luti]|uniref:HK97 gp10 family phage protein n=1 Tax=Bacillus luti TaxID=2026191 RepID=A0A7V7V7M6_9BACI|nr:HK97 gp10 family phage protein [Bacillus luti]KAB2444949.1 HK97 gp10 family phage protein [Bacillus luti]